MVPVLLLHGAPGTGKSTLFKLGAAVFGGQKMRSWNTAQGLLDVGASLFDIPLFADDMQSACDVDMCQLIHMATDGSSRTLVRKQAVGVFMGQLVMATNMVSRMPHLDFIYVLLMSPCGLYACVAEQAG